MAEKKSTIREDRFTTKAGDGVWDFSGAKRVSEEDKKAYEKSLKKPAKKPAKK